MNELINVLIVDDNEQFADTISELLDLEGYSCKTAATISGAVSIFNNHDIDTIICDINLPDGKGTQLLYTIRKEGSHIPVIFISGNMTKDILMECLNLGAFDVFEKPINIPKLFKTLKYSIMKGIQYRSLREKITQVTDEETQKLIGKYLSTIAKIRTNNLDDKSSS